MKTEISIQLILSVPQLEYLADGSYKINRMAMFLHLCKCAELKDGSSRLPGNKGTVRIGQIEKSVKQLSTEWRCDAKTAAKVISAMNRLGILTTESNHITSVHTIHPVAAWIVDNVMIRNPNFTAFYNPAALTHGTFDTTTYADRFTREITDITDTTDNNAFTDNSRGKETGKRKRKDRNTISGQYASVSSVLGIEYLSRQDNNSSTTADKSNTATDDIITKGVRETSSALLSSPVVCSDNHAEDLSLSESCKETDSAKPVSASVETVLVLKRSDIWKDDSTT